VFYNVIPLKITLNLLKDKKIDAFILINGDSLKLKRLKNNQKGFKKIALKTKGALVVMEASGPYYLQLSVYSWNRGFCCKSFSNKTF
jgi:transposase